MSSSVILLGDSIFDNAVYVPGEPCVTEQLQGLLPADVSVRMLAVDGDCIRHVKEQLEQVPEDTTHLFVSVGGNDALEHYETLFGDYQVARDLFTLLHQIQIGFRTQYRGMLEAVVELNRPAAVCTIYDTVPSIEAIALTALSLFNDVIVAEATAMNLPIVDLRHVCNEVSDYSDQSPIEPSSKGGKKIARALHRVYAEHDFSIRRSVVYTG